MRPIALCLLLLATACGSDTSSGTDMAGAAGSSSVVINELFPHGTTEMAPDYAELYNKGTTAVDLTGYKVRDSQLAHLIKIPDGTTIAPDGYVVLNLWDPSDAAAPSGIVIGFQLAAKGDEFHLVGPDGKDVDATLFDATLASTKSWGRLPNGVGSFVAVTPSKGAKN